MLAQARQHREARQHLQGARRAGRVGQFRAGDQLLVDMLLLLHAEAVGHLDHVDAVDEGFVVLVGLEGLPLGFVRVRQDDAGEGDRADVLGADVVALLRRREQRMQHLDRRLEHLDEFEDALVRPVQAAGVGIRIRIGLRQRLQAADIDLADERGDVLVVLVAGFGLGDGDLAQARGPDLDHLELRDVALELVEALQRPRAHQPGQPPARDPVAALDLGPHRLGVEQPERALEDRRDLVAGLEHVDRVHLHQGLEAFGERRLAAADGPEQVEDLLALLQALRGMAEERDDPLDRLLHAEEFVEGRIGPDRPVHEDAAEARILRGVDEFRLADRVEDPLGGAGVHQRFVAARLKEFGERHLRVAARFVPAGEALEKVVGRMHRHSITLSDRQQLHPVPSRTQPTGPHLSQCGERGAGACAECNTRPAR